MDLTYFYEEIDGKTALKQRVVSHKTLADINAMIAIDRPQTAIELHADLFAQYEQWQWLDSYNQYLAEVDSANEFNSNLPIVGYDEDEPIIADKKELPTVPPRPAIRTGIDILKSINYYSDKFKRERAKKVSAITVEVDGMVFDGDETSQNRMQRSLTGMNVADISVVQWKLADNTTAEVTAKQLAKAMLLAGQSQTELWGM